VPADEKWRGPRVDLNGMPFDPSFAGDPLESTLQADPTLHDLLRHFVQDLEIHVHELESTRARGDHAGLRTIVHQLRGAGGSYGYPLITDLAATAERAIVDSAEASTIDSAVTALIHACQRARAGFPEQGEGHGRSAA
jgi:HPt (histidine-containing phosphotransfer) domain-containing protein